MLRPQLCCDSSIAFLSPSSCTLRPHRPSPWARECPAHSSMYPLPVTLMPKTSHNWLLLIIRASAPPSPPPKRPSVATIPAADGSPATLTTSLYHLHTSYRNWNLSFFFNYSAALSLFFTCVSQHSMRIQMLREWMSQGMSAAGGGRA